MQLIGSCSVQYIVKHISRSIKIFIFAQKKTNSLQIQLFYNSFSIMASLFVYPGKCLIKFAFYLSNLSAGLIN